MVEKVLFSVRLTANCLECDSQDLLAEKRSLSARKICGEKMYWLKEHDFHNCRNGAFVGSASST